MRRVSSFLNGFAWLLLLLCAIFCAVCQAQQGSETTTIRVGYAPSFFLRKDIHDANVAIEVWFNTVSRIELPSLLTEVDIFEDFDALENALNAGKIDVAGFLPLEYLRIKNKSSLGAGLVGAKENGGVYETYVLLARRQSGTTDLKQFRGKQMVVSVGNQGNLPTVWLNTLLLKNGLPEADTFFSQVKMLDEVFGAIRQVLMGQAAMCILTQESFDTVVELNPQLKGDLRVVATSPEFCRGFALFRDGFDEQVQVILQETLLALHTDPKGAQIMNFFRVEKLLAFEQDYLNSVIALMDSYETLKKNQ